MTMREEFEEDAMTYWFDLTSAKRPCCAYDNSDTEQRFMGFSAGYIAGQKAMRERAAIANWSAVMDCCASDGVNPSERNDWFVGCASIRALPIEGEE